MVFELVDVSHALGDPQLDPLAVKQPGPLQYARANDVHITVGNVGVLKRLPRKIGRLAGAGSIEKRAGLMPDFCSTRVAATLRLRVTAQTTFKPSSRKPKSRSARTASVA